MSQADIRVVALRLQATREHSRSELKRKLLQRGYDAAAAAAVIDEFATQNLQNDHRFIENYIESRQRRGIGPIRILAELRERGISEEQIAPYLDLTDPQWVKLGQQVRQKKFGASPPADFDAKVRQLRFLEYRGFSHEQLRRIIETADDIA